MLSPSWDTVRLFLHILAATVWVGGQLTLAALVPVLRGQGNDLSRMVARQFNRIAWPAFAVLLATGVWNMIAEGDKGAHYRTTVSIKMVVVVISGVTAFLHTRARTRSAVATYGALTGLSALLALFLGVLLAG